MPDPADGSGRGAGHAADPEPAIAAGPDRRGRPSPLVFHLAAAAAIYQQAILLAPGAESDGFPWHPALDARPGAAPAPMAVALEASARLRAMLDGIAAWQAHPWRRNPAPVPVLWRDGSTALSAYAGDGVPVLVVPSLINRAYVLDLTPDRSFLRGLAALGLRPFLLDWGGPGTVEQGFDLDAYVQRRLLPALSIIEAITGQRAAMLGYCMGGTLAAAAAARLPGRVARLCTVGAPWDFGADTGSLAGRVRALMAAGGASQPALALRNVADAFGLVPCDLFQLLFALVNPVQALVKFRRFAALDPDSDEARHFVALEDWLADGVDMAGPAAIDLLVRWQIDNALASGRFSLLGGRVQARDIRCPALVVAGRVDRIAPPAGALALADAIPGARRLEPPLGHVGMIVGRDSGALVAAPVAAFLRGEG